jgi:PKD repeat protein
VASIGATLVALVLLFVVVLPAHAEPPGRPGRPSFPTGRAVALGLPPPHSSSSNLAAVASVFPTGPVAIDISVQLNATVTGGVGPYAFTWFVGDGAEVSGPNLTHAYGEPGSYLAVVEVTDSAGDRAFASVGIPIYWVYGPPSVVAQANAQTVGAGTLILFTSNYTSYLTPASSYDWSFTDGTSSGLADPTHTFQHGGVYPVILVVSDIAQVLAWYVITIFVQPGPPVVTASATPSLGYPPLRVSLTTTVAGGWQDINCDPGESPLRCAPPQWSYAWAFGDGQTATNGTTANATHTYAAAGQYLATLNVTDYLNDSITVQVPVNVEVPPPLRGLTISANVTSGPAPLTVGFVGSVVGGVAPLSFTWRFGDGPASSIAVSVAHTYAAAGRYVVNLTVFDSADQSISTELTITVQAARDGGGNGPLPLGLGGAWQTPLGLALLVALGAVVAVAVVLVLRRRRRRIDPTVGLPPSPSTGGTEPDPPGAGVDDPPT